MLSVDLFHICYYISLRCRRLETFFAFFMESTKPNSVCTKTGNASPKLFVWINPWSTLKECVFHDYSSKLTFKHVSCFYFNTCFSRGNYRIKPIDRIHEYLEMGPWRPNSKTIDTILTEIYFIFIWLETRIGRIFARILLCEGQECISFKMGWHNNKILL